MANASLVVQQSLSGTAALTAGTVQTQAGGAVPTAQVSVVTTGSASDGVTLPVGCSGMTLLLKVGATATNVYPPVGGSINAGTVNAAAVPTASKTNFYLYVDNFNVVSAAFA